MMCLWKELTAILPPRLRREAEALEAEPVLELRLRLDMPAEAVLPGKSLWLDPALTDEELRFVVNAASRYSPWTAATLAQGYLTAPGGHRVGVCGEVVCRDGVVEGVRTVTSLCVRVARDLPGVARRVAQLQGNLLILGPPGWGKTTLLRDLIRQLSQREPVCVVDERGELFPRGFSRGRRTDVLTGCPKPAGVDMALRTMSPACVALDEITAVDDAMALLRAANCGVRLLATAHAADARDLGRRTVYRPLVRQRVFDHLIVLHRDRTYHTERMAL